MAFTAASLFLLTLVLVVWQPRKLGIGWSASGGALLALLAGVVSFSDVLEVTGIVWNATLTFIAMILISLVLEEIGFFDWASLHVVRMAKGNGTLTFVYVVLLGAAVSAFFTNDGAILIITPIVLAMVRALRLPDGSILPFVMASGFIADAASLPFVTSNLTNIISADFFGIGFAEYASRLTVPNLFAIAASIAVLWLYFRKNIPQRFDLTRLQQPHEAIRDMRLFRFSWVLLGVLMLAYFASEWISVPVSLVASLAAAILLALVSRNPDLSTARLVKGAPWSVLFFSIGMYVVVYGLRNAGMTDMLCVVIRSLADHGLFAATMGTGFLAAFLSSVMNNLPTMMIDALAIQGTGAQGVTLEALVYANVVGSNLGPKMTPIGSLATLLWLHVLSRKGVTITWGYYCKVGIALTIPTLFMTLAGLVWWLRTIHATGSDVWLAIGALVLGGTAVLLVAGMARARKQKGRMIGS